MLTNLLKHLYFDIFFWYLLQTFGLIKGGISSKRLNIFRNMKRSQFYRVSEAKCCFAEVKFSINCSSICINFSISMLLFSSEAKWQVRVCWLETLDPEWQRQSFDETILVNWMFESHPYTVYVNSHSHSAVTNLWEKFNTYPANLLQQMGEINLCSIHMFTPNPNNESWHWAFGNRHSVHPPWDKNELWLCASAIRQGRQKLKYRCKSRFIFTTFSYRSRLALNCFIEN